MCGIVLGIVGCGLIGCHMDLRVLLPCAIIVWCFVGFPIGLAIVVGWFLRPPTFTVFGGGFGVNYGIDFCA